MGEKGLLLAAGLFLMPGLLVLGAEQRASSRSESGRLELRRDYGGQLVRGVVRISPRSEGESGSLAMDGVSIQPSWDSATVQDGWHEASLQFGEQKVSASLAVLNRADVVIHQGLLSGDETWTADKVHVVRHWVRVPKYKMLTIATDAVVKFCNGTGIHVDGTLKGVNVYLTSVHDDSLGGDTDMNGSSQPPAVEPVYAIRGDGTIDLVTRRRCRSQSSFGELEGRRDFGGRLVRGQVRISPLDQAVDTQASLTLGNQPAGGWTVAEPHWQSTQVSDGWHDATLSEQGQAHTESLAVLNADNVLLHSGVLTGDETWASDRIHVIKHWVRIPQGTTLTINAGAVVKFCPLSGIQVDGTLIARKVIFTTVDDDTAGGDTDMDGAKTDDGDYEIIINGTADLADSDIRHSGDFPENLVWEAGSVHVIQGIMAVPAGKTLTIEPGAIVKMATGAKLKMEAGGNIVCDGAIFTHLPDDTIGGDTEKNGDATQPAYDQYGLVGFVPPESCDLRYLTMVYEGWSLFAPGADVTATSGNGQLLDQFSVFSLGPDCYQRATLPVAAGTGLWLYSEKPQVVAFNYEDTKEQSSLNPDGWQKGWNLVGVPGEAGAQISLSPGDRVWQWKGRGYELVMPNQDGQVTLRSGQGYFIYHVPAKRTVPQR